MKIRFKMYNSGYSRWYRATNVFKKGSDIIISAIDVETDLPIKFPYSRLMCDVDEELKKEIQLAEMA